MVDRDAIQSAIAQEFISCPGNVISPREALSAEVAGLTMFDAPLVGFARADDPLFERFRAPGVIGPWLMLPGEWLPGARTVVALFFPHTEAVRRANRLSQGRTADAWLHGRIEGQRFIDEFMRRLCVRIARLGPECCAPSQDARFKSVQGGVGMEGFPGMDARTFGSNWSERHAAYVAGLGTFGLSRGLITRRGMAGRFASFITDAALPADARGYQGVYDYCINCGACARRCPAGAIRPGQVKDHVTCAAWLKETARLYAPRYGCGLCQTGVPCEAGIPRAERRDG